MKRILLACHQFFPRHRTGTETLTLETAMEFRRRGMEAAVITVEPLQTAAVPTWEKDVYEGITVYRIVLPGSPAASLRREWSEARLQPIFNKICDDFKPDVVQVFHLMRLTADFVEVVKGCHIPCYMTMTDFWLLCPNYQLLKPDDMLCEGPEPDVCALCLQGKSVGAGKAKLRSCLTWLWEKFYLREKHEDMLRERQQRHQTLAGELDGMIWANAFARGMFHKNGLRGKQEAVIPFPLPNMARNLTELPCPGKTGPLKVAFIGTFRPSKGPHIFLEACRLAGNEEIEFHLWGGFGDPAYEKALQEMAAGMDNVHFRGTFPQEQFAEVLRDIHAVVIPSLWYENSPLTAISVLAAKRVLIVSRLGGLSDLVAHGETGYEFPAGDSEALADILRNLAQDREKVEAVAKAILPVHFIENYVDELGRMYEEKP